ncbi:hypothetical protein J437_LFUL018971 [Ladona fulva]|uniref:Uncharacterized protein n=1 Tax=Ladona fulva TaxID=123851 RepID=A0A8K0KU87_LADFU|nr:hypothetical protein J437_LFUL018971 [Ladona fulva]
MPTSQHFDEEVEECHEKIELIAEEERRNACIVVMGHFNAVVGEGGEGKTLGRFGLVSEVFEISSISSM